MLKVLKFIKKLLGFATDHVDELGLPKGVKLVLEGGRAVGFWDQAGNYHQLDENGKEVLY